MTWEDAALLRGTGDAGVGCWSDRVRSALVVVAWMVPAASVVGEGEDDCEGDALCGMEGGNGPAAAAAAAAVTSESVAAIASATENPGPIDWEDDSWLTRLVLQQLVAVVGELMCEIETEGERCRPTSEWLSTFGVLVKKPASTGSGFYTYFEVMRRRAHMCAGCTCIHFSRYR